MRALAVLIGFAACAHAPPRIGVRGIEVMAHLEELGREGAAQLDTVIVNKAKLKAADRETVFLYQTVTFRGETTTLAKLVDGCPPFNTGAACALAKRASEIIVLRTLEPNQQALAPTIAEPQPIQTNGQNHEVAVVSGALTLASLGGMTLCLIICETDKAAKSIALGGAGLVFAVVWAVASGARD